MGLSSTGFTMRGQAGFGGGLDPVASAAVTVNVYDCRFRQCLEDTCGGDTRARGGRQGRRSPCVLEGTGAGLPGDFHGGADLRGDHPGQRATSGAGVAEGSVGAGSSAAAGRTGPPPTTG